MELQPNQLFNNRYRLIEAKGSGSFGEVWLAHDERVDINVAIKIYIALDDRGIQDFISEYRNAYRLNHPNLLHAEHFDMEGRRPYLVMPYCPGKSTNLIGNNNERDIWLFVHDVAKGLAYLHSQDIIHHDIKPDNILRDEGGVFVITDFGISTKMRSTLRRNSKREISNSIGGALPYMGPETFSDDPTAVKATDIWAFGATLFEIITGELPFFGQGGVMLMNGAAIPRINNEVSEQLKHLVYSCMQKETWDRPTAEQIAEYADQILKGDESYASWFKSVGPTTGAAGEVDDPRKTQRFVNQNQGYTPAEEFDSRQTVKQGEGFTHVAEDNGYSGNGGNDRAADDAQPAKRNLFVSIILWFGLFCTMFACAVAILYVTEFVGLDGLTPWRCLGALLAVEVLGLWMMIKNVRLGYSIYSLSMIAASLAVVFTNGSNVEISDVAGGLISSLISVSILYWLLQIRKSGKTAWSIMTNSWNMLSVKIVGGVAVVAVLLSFTLPNGLKREVEKAYDEYLTMVENCRTSINATDGSDVKVLLDIESRIDDIERVEGDYSAYKEGFDLSSELRSSFAPVAQRVAQNWARAAESQAEIGNHKRALEFYNTALTLDSNNSEIRSKFEALADDFAFVNVIDVEFCQDSNPYGEEIKASEVKYVYTRVKVEPIDKNGEHQIKLRSKLYYNGVLQYNTDISTSYTFESELNVSPQTEYLYLLGWGNEDGGSYLTGTYRMDIYNGNKKLFSKSFTVR